MPVKYVHEDKSSENIKKLYKKIKEAFGVKQLPLFFGYFGGFPEFLEYITPQIISNLKDSSFEKNVSELKEAIGKILSDYKTFDSEENFPQEQKRELERIFSLNIKLAIIFIAIREAIKGWALGVKKLSSGESFSSRIVFEEDKEAVFSFNFSSFLEESSAIIKQEQGKALDPGFLPEFMKRQFYYFQEESQKEKFLYLRLGIEKLLLFQIQLLPQKIELSIGRIYPLISKYPGYEEFIYLLSEKFPVLSVHRLIFSGLILKYTG